MRFRKIISGTFTGVPFLILHAFIALRAMFVAFGTVPMHVFILVAEMSARRLRWICI